MICALDTHRRRDQSCRTKHAAQITHQQIRLDLSWAKARSKASPACLRSPPRRAHLRQAYRTVTHTTPPGPTELRGEKPNGEIFSASALPARRPRNTCSCPFPPDQTTPQLFIFASFCSLLFPLSAPCFPCSPCFAATPSLSPLPFSPPHPSLFSILWPDPRQQPCRRRRESALWASLRGMGFVEHDLPRPAPPRAALPPAILAIV